MTHTTTQKTTYTLTETNVITNTLEFDDKSALLTYLAPTVAPNQKWPFTTQDSSAPSPELASVEYIIALLDDPRFTLRTLLSVCARTGLSADLVYGMLDDADVEYVIKHKRGTREELIGLASRN